MLIGMALWFLGEGSRKNYRSKRLKINFLLFYQRIQTHHVFRNHGGTSFSMYHYAGIDEIQKKGSIWVLEVPMVFSRRQLDH